MYQDFWEDKVAKGHKHFATHMTNEKKNRLLNRFNKHLINNIDLSKINSAIDFGCGGGLLSKTIPINIKLTLVDISTNSLREAKRYLNRSVELIQVSDIDDFEINFDSPDLLWCYSMIHHLPSIKEWNKLVKLWLKIKPKVIGLQTKVGKLTVAAKDYKNLFFDGLILTKSDFVDCFTSQYKITHYDTEEMPNINNYHMGFVVLQSK